jgi:hypothetical protein
MRKVTVQLGSFHRGRQAGPARVSSPLGLLACSRNKGAQSPIGADGVAAKIWAIGGEVPKVVVLVTMLEMRGAQLLGCAGGVLTRADL